MPCLVLIGACARPCSTGAAIGSLRQALDAAGYTAEAVRALLGTDAYRTGLAEVQRRTCAGSLPAALGTIVRLFFLGAETPAGEVEGALAPLADRRPRPSSASREDDGAGVVRPHARIVPHAGLMIASDPYSRGTVDPEDYVPGFTAVTATCVNLTVRRDVDSALDIGTGCGVQALLAAGHSRRVVATDVNERALEYTAFNAALNGLENLELRLGNLFEPVDGERFELVVCNAPYVVSPDVRFAYRDAGARGDSFSERLVRQCAAHLADGATATLMVSWLRPAGSDWATRPRVWAEGSGCDAWILGGQILDPIVHTARWNDGAVGDAEAFEVVLERWLPALAELGADAVVEGAILLRRRTGGSGWIRADLVPPEAPEPASAQVLRVLEARGAVDNLDDEALLDCTFDVAESAVVDETSTLEGGRRQPLSSRIRLRDGLLFAVALDPGALELIAALDGRTTLRRVAAAVADRHGLDGAEIHVSDGRADPGAARARLSERSRSGMTASPAPVVEPNALLALRELVRATEYTGPRIQALLGTDRELLDSVAGLPRASPPTRA